VVFGEVQAVVPSLETVGDLPALADVWFRLIHLRK
jgi:hypothetical protein